MGFFELQPFFDAALVAGVEDDGTVGVERIMAVLVSAKVV